MAAPSSSGRFGVLGDLWPTIREVGEQAERAADTEPTFAAVRLRGLTEMLVEHIHEKIETPRGLYGTHFERLKMLQQQDLLDPVLLAKFHTIRMFGNKAAHNGEVTREQVNSLLEDAASLVAWFCRFMRPDLAWLTPADRTSESNVAPESRHSGATGTVVKFPEERIRRIRESVARAMSEVDPSVRQLRTRVTLQDAFGEELTDDQKGCITALELFLGDPDQRIFLLKGYAGTGKTFLAKGLTEFLLAQGRSFQLAAPTGRAAKVIAEKTNQPARTLHSLIYDFTQMKEYSGGDELDGSETFKVYAEIKSNTWSANAVFIVDEASLLSDVYSESEFFRSGSGYLLQDFFTFLALDQRVNDRKVIFLGDPAQLPPVGMSSSPALDTGYLREHFGVAAVEYELKEVVRQKAESSIIRNVMPIRESLEKDSYGSVSFWFDQDVVRVWPDDVPMLYVTKREAHGADAPLVITHSNREAADLNRAIRSRLFPGKEFVTAGDRLLVTSNGVVDGHFLANGEFVHVEEVNSNVERRSVTLRRKDPATGKVEHEEVVLLFRDLRIAVAAPDGAEAVLDTKVLEDHLHGPGSGLTSAQQRALYIDFLKRHPDLRRERDRAMFLPTLKQDRYYNALRVKFGYAVTCHKAQGGEWSQVFVSCPTRQNSRTSGYFRWLYTAMTRASSKLYLMNPPEMRIKLAGPPLDGAVSPPLSAGVPTMASRDGLPADGAVSSPVLAGVPTMSSHEAFRQGLLSKVRAILEGTGIEIEDVAHHQYQEAFFLRRGPDAARVNVAYNGKLIVTRIAPPPANAFGDELGRLLAPLAGRSPMQAPEGDGVGTSVATPTLPFLREFHDQLLPLLEAKQIQVVSLKELTWNQRYTFARASETATVDVFYNGKNRITKCAPVHGPGSFARAPGPLQRDVLEVIMSVIVL